MTTKVKILIVLAIAAISFASGRFLAPIKTVEVVKEVERKEKEKEVHKTKKTVEKTNPDGSKETTTTETEDSTTTTTTEKDKSSSKETERSSSKIHVAALAGMDITKGLNPALIVYGASVSKDILGPISIGVFGFNDGRLGLSVGLSF